MNLSQAKKDEIELHALGFERRVQMMWEDMVSDLAHTLNLKMETVEKILEEVQ